MEHLYIAHRLLQECGLGSVQKNSYEALYERLRGDSDRLLHANHIHIPRIRGTEALVKYYMRQWWSIRDTSDKAEVQILALFTLTRLLCLRYKSEGRLLVIPLLMSCFIECISDTTPPPVPRAKLSWFSLAKTALAAIGGYEVFVLCMRLYSKTFMS